MDAIYWVIILGVLVVFYILLMVRQKRQDKRNLEMLNNFKVGDKVVTHIGVYGRIKRIYNTTYGKVCVLEVGVSNKVDIEVDLRYIAGIDEKTIAPEDPVKLEEVKETSTQSKNNQIKENTTANQAEPTENKENDEQENTPNKQEQSSKKQKKSKK